MVTGFLRQEQYLENEMKGRGQYISCGYFGGGMFCLFDRLGIFYCFTTYVLLNFFFIFSITIYPLYTLFHFQLPHPPHNHHNFGVDLIVLYVYFLCFSVLSQFWVISTCYFCNNKK